jgi:hypothetical protein
VLYVTDEEGDGVFVVTAYPLAGKQLNAPSSGGKRDADAVPLLFLRASSAARSSDLKPLPCQPLQLLAGPREISLDFAGIKASSLFGNLLLDATEVVQILIERFVDFSHFTVSNRSDFGLTST